MRGIQRHYRMDRRRIAYFRFILEGYDGLANLRTDDPAQGRITLCLDAARGPELDELLADIDDELGLEPAPAPGQKAAGDGESTHD